MRTVRCSGCPMGGVFPVGCLPRGCTPPPCGQTDTCENITFPQLLLRTVIKLNLHNPIPNCHLRYRNSECHHRTFLFLNCPISRGFNKFNATCFNNHVQKRRCIKIIDLNVEVHLTYLSSEPQREPSGCHSNGSGSRGCHRRARDASVPSCRTWLAPWGSEQVF